MRGDINAATPPIILNQSIPSAKLAKIINKENK